jgi:hypothetical protein
MDCQLRHCIPPRHEADTDKRIDSYMTKNSAEDYESNLSDIITLSYFTISYKE